MKKEQIKVGNFYNMSLSDGGIGVRKITKKCGCCPDCEFLLYDTGEVEDDGSSIDEFILPVHVISPVSLTEEFE